MASLDGAVGKLGWCGLVQWGRKGWVGVIRFAWISVGSGLVVRGGCTLGVVSMEGGVNVLELVVGSVSGVVGNAQCLVSVVRSKSHHVARSLRGTDQERGSKFVSGRVNVLGVAGTPRTHVASIATLLRIAGLL